MSDPEPSVVWLVLEASLDATVLALAIGGLLLLAGRRISPVWRHGFWMLVAIRLLLPFLPSSPTSWKHWLTEYRDPIVEVVRDPAATLPILPSEREETSRADRAASTTASTEFVAQPSRAQNQKTGGSLSVEQNRPDPVLNRVERDWKWWLAPVWLCGVTVSVLLILLAVWNFKRKLVRAERGNADQEGAIGAMLEQLCLELRIRRIPGLWITAAVDSPALTGIVAPRILLPLRTAAELHPDELRYVLMHELGHLRRMDLWSNWLLSLLQALHWFNPVIWWAFYRSRIEAERATDDWVLRRIDRGENERYGQTLLRLLELKSNLRGLSPGVLGVVESSRDLRFRIGAVGRFAKRKSRIIAGFTT